MSNFGLAATTPIAYNYRVINVAKVIDGDTFDFDVDLGFYTRIRIRVRLADIDTYEVYGVNAHELGPQAREFAQNWLQETMQSESLFVYTFKLNSSTPTSDGAFGRWLGEVYDGESGQLLADALGDAGFAKE